MPHAFLCPRAIPRFFESKNGSTLFVFRTSWSENRFPLFAKRSKYLVLAGLAAVALQACSGGMKEAYETRVCWDGGFPGQCSEAVLTFSCDQPIPVTAPETARTGGSSGTLGTRLLNDMTAPRIGELFSQTCPPNCIPIYVKDGSPFQTLRDDLEDILNRAGFRIKGEGESKGVGDGAEPANVLEIDLLLVDTRSDKPGFWDMKATTRAEVSFQVRLVISDGTRLWQQDFNGKDDVAHSYAALSDYQKVLSGAYCKALTGFADAVSEGRIDLGP